MCRFLAYQGEPILMESLICAPAHSLIHQSMHAAEGKTEINGDGFGMGWYGERPEPGLYRELRPAWSDENLLSVAALVRSRAFFAHVRAATGTAISRANCHPFASGRWLFMHNGQVGGWQAVRRRVEGMIPDRLYPARGGTTDSEAIFLAALGDGLDEDPVGALRRTLATVKRHMTEAGVSAPLRFTASLTDGETMWAFRWSCDQRPPTLYWRETGHAGLLVVSEPIDGDRNDWHALPSGASLTARGGRLLDVTQAADAGVV